MKARIAAFFRSVFRWVLGFYVAGTFFAIGIVLLVAGTPVGEWLETRQRQGCTRFENLRSADAIVVLGGDEGTRSIAAEKAFRAGKAPRLIISADEDFILDALTAGGIPRSRIAIDVLPERTIDHPQTILKIPGISHKSRLIVTSSRLQERRAKFLFEQAGFVDVQVFSVDNDRELFKKEHPEKFPPCTWHFERVYYVAYAYLAWLKYFLVD